MDILLRSKISNALAVARSKMRKMHISPGKLEAEKKLYNIQGDKVYLNDIFALR